MRRGVVMRGTRYETPYYIKDSRVEGPTVVVIGGVHGDEKAGFLAARQIARWKITRGRMVIMTDAHREAIRRNVRGYPGNMNNMFPGKARGSDMERLAFEIWNVIKAARPSLLLTLHESRDFHARDATRYGQTFCFDFPELIPDMTRAMDRANQSIEEREHKFLIFVKPFPSCPTYQAWARLRVPATSIETSRTLPLATRIRYQKAAVRAFFDSWSLGYQISDAPLQISALAPDAERPNSEKPAPQPASQPDSQPASQPTSEDAQSTSTSLRAAPGPKAQANAPAPGAIVEDDSRAAEARASTSALPALALALLGAGVGFGGWRLSEGRRSQAQAHGRRR